MVQKDLVKIDASPVAIVNSKGTLLKLESASFETHTCEWRTSEKKIGRVHVISIDFQDTGKGEQPICEM